MSSLERVALFCLPPPGGRQAKERRFFGARYPGRCPGLLSFAPTGLRSGLTTKAEPPPNCGVRIDGFLDDWIGKRLLTSSPARILKGRFLVRASSPRLLQILQKPNVFEKWAWFLAESSFVNCWFQVGSKSVFGFLAPRAFPLGKNANKWQKSCSYSCGSV